ncbi:MAG TPA: RluA family pseudouridine synthase [Caulobacteraceae bacterium]
MAEVRTLSVEADDDGVRLDRWLRRRWPQLGQIQIHKLARSGQLRVDGARVRADTRLACGAQVRVPPMADAPPKARGAALSPRDIAFAKSLVLFEDDQVLVLNKPAGLAVQGGTKTSRHLDGLLGAWGAGMTRPRLVHRLDRDTSGVIVLGRTPAAAAALAGAFAKRLASKTYWAIVHGVPSPEEGTIDLPLAKIGIGDRELVTAVGSGDARGAAATSEFFTITGSTQGAAWLALSPLTGRNHQLRAHLLAIGHPILGDPKYNTAASKAFSGALKLQLHARRLAIPHPAGRGMLDIEAPISAEMTAGFARFGFDEGTAPADPFARHGRG